MQFADREAYRLQFESEEEFVDWVTSTREEVEYLRIEDYSMGVTVSIERSEVQLYMSFVRGTDEA